MLVVDWSEFSKDPRLVLLSLKPSKVNRTEPQSTIETILTIEMISIDIHHVSFINTLKTPRKDNAAKKHSRCYLRSHNLILIKKP